VNLERRSEAAPGLHHVRNDYAHVVECPARQ
jgi:hypothetical protein